ncbi:MAG: LysR family transcriptional regulator [Pseudomonadota bacterium]
MPLSLRAMRYVQAAMQLGSITGAAGVMHVAPSAISKALDQAEAAFGVTLVTRARAKGISVTLAGRDALRGMSDLLERYDAMLADVTASKESLSGTLTIAYNAPIAPAFLPAITARLRSAHPEITLALYDGDNTTVQAGLLNGSFDAILFVEEIPNPQIETIPLLFAPTYCLCPADHRLARGGAVAISEVLKEPLVLLDRPAARAYYTELLERGGAGYQIVATTNSTEMARSLVAVGTGVSLLSMRPAEAAPYAGDTVKCVSIIGEPQGVTLSLGFPPGPRRRVLQVFIEAFEVFLRDGDAENFIVRAAAEEGL